MRELQEKIAITALNNMMKGSHFNICTIDSIATMLGVNAKCLEYDMLRPLHCVDWDKMPQEVRDAIPELIKICVGVIPTYQFEQEKLFSQETGKFKLPWKR